jgi:hypothetical protein
MGVQIETPGQDPVNLNWQYLDSGVWIRGARRPEDVATKLRLQKLQLPPGDFVDFPAWYTVFVYFRSVDMPGWCALKVGRLGIGDSLKLKKFATWLTAYSAERVAEK